MCDHFTRQSRCSWDGPSVSHRWVNPGSFPRRSQDDARLILTLPNLKHLFHLVVKYFSGTEIFQWPLKYFTKHWNIAYINFDWWNIPVAGETFQKPVKYLTSYWNISVASTICFCSIMFHVNGKELIHMQVVWLYSEWTVYTLLGDQYYWRLKCCFVYVYLNYSNNEDRWLK